MFVDGHRYVEFVHDLAEKVEEGNPVPFTPRVQAAMKGTEGGELKDAAQCDTSFSKGLPVGSRLTRRRSPTVNLR